jgi:hypothetical protein
MGVRERGTGVAVADANAELSFLDSDQHDAACKHCAGEYDPSGKEQRQRCDLTRCQDVGKHEHSESGSS